MKYFRKRKSKTTEKTSFPKLFYPLSEEQEIIRNDFVKYWQEIIAGQKRYKIIEKFNHNYVVKYAPKHFLHTLEIGAGLGKHLEYEHLTLEQKKNYVALELRENMAEQIKIRHPDVQIYIADCQTTLSFPDNHFDRILAIHVLEHLPNLPETLKEMYRVCKKKHGICSIVIPCEGGLAYALARKLSAQRIFEKRYNQAYEWFIKREHINKPNEILQLLENYFTIEHQRFFPFLIPSIHLNLCIGLTLRPRNE